MIAWDDYVSDYSRLGVGCDYSSPMMVKVMYMSPPIADVPLIEPDSPGEAAAIESYDIDQLPFVFTDTCLTDSCLTDSCLTPLYDQSVDWVNLSLSPYEDNLYLTPVEEVQPMHKAGNIIVQHNTYTTISQNFINNNTQPDQQETYELDSYELVRPRRTQKVRPVYTESDYYEELEEDSESDHYLSELVSKKKKKVTPKRKSVPDKNEERALKQLLSAESTSKQRKTILFVGKDSKNGHTIQKISFDDPQIQCSEIDVDHEVTVEEPPSPTPKKKKFQCDKCKKIFDRISAFHQHVTGKHTSTKSKSKKEVLRCNDCGRNFKTYDKYQKHCLGHGDPDLECPKCHKVYASNATLRVHMKIHDRKYPCSYCCRTYATADTYHAHLKKSHAKFMCTHENCSFMANSETVLTDHLQDHIYEQNEEKAVFDRNNNTKAIERNVEEYIDHMQLDQLNMIPNDTDLTDVFEDDYSDVDLNEESVLLDEVKTESKPTQYMSRKEVEERQKIKDADAVIEKVMKSKIFQKYGKGATKHDKKSKSDKTCTICGKSFDRTSDFKRHSIEHLVKATLAKTISSELGFLDIVCLVCEEESFDSIDKYKAHLRKHVHLTTYQCTFCDKSFSDSSNFSKHKKIHGVSHFQCDLCNRKFNSKAMLSRHMEYHNKHAPLKCQTCGRYFHFESMLKKHIRTAHKMASTKVHCTFCDKVLSTLKEKWDHEWDVHNIRKSANDCHICEARFRKYSELKKHYSSNHNLDLKTARATLKKADRYR